MKPLSSTVHESLVGIPCQDVILDGDLSLPPQGAKGLVVFAHGSGSSRMSPRNRMVAAAMQQRGLATLLFDLLTPQEAAADAYTGELRFNIPFLTRRLHDVTRWAGREESLSELGIGLFGSSTGAAAALAVAASLPQVRAVVSRGGRTDLAAKAASDVNAPTLLIAGARDEVVLELNRETLERLAGEKQLAIIEGATHLFEEPGALEQVAELAAAWFDQHLSTLTPGQTRSRS